ncbi:hypothetical protein TNCV_4372441 [Trichonephila clavipes]|nr:hypothetical protein TNCV_4372441 [Trichonephila clavipes]
METRTETVELVKETKTFRHESRIRAEREQREKENAREVGKPIDENAACVEVGKPIDENPACVEVGTNSV